MDYLLAGSCGILFILCVIMFVRYNRQSTFLSYYRGYFRESQRLAGKDPDSVLRDSFPSTWRVM